MLSGTSFHFHLVLLFGMVYLIQASLDNYSTTETEECYLYLAPSSIQGAGMGVFSTRKINKGSTILSSDYGPLIPIIDGHAVHDHWIGLFNNYIWSHFSMAPDELWYEAEVVTDFQPGLGIFPNYHPYLVNLGAALADNATFSTAEENSKSGPGVGAYSEYVGRSFFAMEDIEEGDELFLDYGEQFLNDRSPLMDDIPRSFDYEMAGRIIENILKENILFHVANDLDEENSTSREDASITEERGE
jgi:hypothetical protein